ncbi:hypothetical protein [Thermus sp.]|uniref:hypothetical protein n=1 Tax=Thermus sp. TaxID=275 RepID=UPI002628694C|nr:hypothetical protein [Thermus sp.]MCX7850520.1 hypothetical protein [Thermus sp.]
MRLVAHLLSGLAAAFWLLLLFAGALGSGERRRGFSSWPGGGPALGDGFSWLEA